MPNKSSRKMHAEILEVMPKARAIRILLDWANLPLPVLAGRFRGRGRLSKPADIEPAFRRMLKRYPEVFTQQGVPMPEKQAFDLMVLFANLLRAAWDAPSLRQREWYLADAESFYHTALNRFGDPPTHALPLEALVYYFRRNSEGAKHCANPDCQVMPYFFLKKKGQKFCSETCSIPAQRAAKLRWWNENRRSKRNRTRATLRQKA